MKMKVSWSVSGTFATQLGNPHHWIFASPESPLRLHVLRGLSAAMDHRWGLKLGPTFMENMETWAYFQKMSEGPENITSVHFPAEKYPCDNIIGALQQQITEKDWLLFSIYLPTDDPQD